MLRLWFCWKGKREVKLTDTANCIPPGTEVGLRINFEDRQAVQDFTNILRVDGFNVDVTDLDYAR